MLRNILCFRKQPAKIDHVLEVSTSRDEVSRCSPVAFCEIAAGAHEVDQIIGRFDSVESAGERLGVLDVSAGGFYRRGPRPARDSSRVAHHDLDVVALFEQSGHEAAADVAGSAGDENLHVFLPL